MSQLYEEIIKKQYDYYSFKPNELSAKDYVELLCSTTNINEETKIVLKQGLDKLHSKREQYIQYAVYKKYTEHIEDNVEEYMNAHNIRKSEIDKIFKYIWDKLPEHIRTDWYIEYTNKNGFRFSSYMKYPYLLHLYKLNENEVNMIHTNYGQCKFGLTLSHCLLNMNRCNFCKIHLKPETNMNNAVEKLIKNMKNDFDMNYITNILMNVECAQHLFLLNSVLCKIYMYNSIRITKKEISENIIKMRVKIKEYMKVHELIHKKVVSKKKK